MTGANEKYTTKRYINMHIAFKIQKSSERVWHVEISASIHRYVNYFDIQVLMMVTETETLTSTLHRDIFTYLDYIFSCNLQILYIYIYYILYILYIYIYIYIICIYIIYIYYIYIYILYILYIYYIYIKYIYIYNKYI